MWGLRVRARGVGGGGRPPGVASAAPRAVLDSDTGRERCELQKLAVAAVSEERVVNGWSGRVGFGWV